MQLIIDIDEYDYKKVKELVSDGVFDYEGTTAHLFKSVVNGTPLPKGHRRLIDADKLLVMTDSYKNELGRLKADPFVKSGIETVEGFINDLPKVDAISLDKVKQAREKFISKYPKNYMGEPELGGRTCYFSLNDVLEILDKLIESEENE